METLEAEFNQIKSSSEYVDVNETMGLYVNDVLPNWQHAVKMQSKGIQSHNANIQIEYEAQRKLGLGDVDGARDDLEKLAQLDPSQRARVDILKAEAPVNSVLAIAENLMESGNYEGVVSELGKLAGKDLTPEQFQLKEGLLATAEKSQDKFSSALLNDVHKKAQTMNLSDFRTELINTQGLDDKQKTLLLDEFVGAQKRWQDTGEDSFTTTRNWSMWYELKMGISEGKITKPGDIWKKVLSDPDISTKGPPLGYVQINDLLGDLPAGEKNAVLKTESAKLQNEHIKDLYSTEVFEYKTPSGEERTDRRIPFENLGVYQSKLDEIDALRIAYKDNPVRLQQEIEASLVDVRKSNVKGWLRRQYDFATSFQPDAAFAYAAKSQLGVGKYFDLYRAGKYGLSLLPKTELAEKTDEELIAERKRLERE